MDAGLNGNIVDPGAIMQPANAPLLPDTGGKTEPVRTGLGSVGLPFLMLYLLIISAHLARFRCRR